IDRRLRESEADLRCGQERHALAMQAANEGLYDWDVVTGILYVSPRVEEIFGFSSADMRSVEVWRGKIVDEDWPRYHEATLAYFRGKADTVTCEYRINDGHGHERWILERSMGARGPDGRIIRMIGSVGDITELKRAEAALLEAHADLELRVTERTMMLRDTTKALRQREERLQGIMNAVVDGIVTTDERGTIESFNPAAERIFGYTAEETLGKNVSMLMREHEAAGHGHSMEEYLRTGRAAIIGIGREMVGRRKDGSIFPCDLAISELRQGNQRLFIGVVRDITRRKEAEEALRESERRYRNIFEQSVEGIFQSTTSGRYIEANPALARLYGYETPDEMKRLITDISTQVYADPRSRETFLRMIEQYGAVRDLEYELRRRDGSTVWVVENCWAVRDSESAILYYEGTVQDITARKRAEREIAEKSAILAATLENITQGVAILDEQHCLLGCNPLFLGMHGLDAALARPGTDFAEIVAAMRAGGDAVQPECPESRVLADLEGNRESCKGERTLPTGLVVQIAAKRIPGGRLLLTYTDVTDLKRREAELRLSEERYALAARGANDGLWDWDLRSDKVYYSPRWKSMLGCDEDEVSASPDEWFSRVHSDDVDELKASIQAHLSGATTHIEIEYRIRHGDGRFRWVLTRGLSVVDPATHEVTRIAGSQTDITERKRAEQQLLHDAFHDGLTGLPNRALFMDRLGQAVSRAKRNPERTFAVLFLDIDRFKYVNDSLGHSAGDGLIVALARRISGCRRTSDTVARLGGDEFAVLLEDLRELDDAIAVAEQVQTAIMAPLVLRGQEVFPTASIGIAWGSAEYDRPEDILSDADLAMYRAKAAGKSRHEVFESGMRTNSMLQLGLETDLRRAFEREEMVLYYQPIIDLQDSNIAGFEALMRWRHATRGLVSPAEFIPLAEETGLIVPLGWWAFQEACSRICSWNEQGLSPRQLFMSINVSARQFKDKDLIDNIARWLSASQLDPHCVKMEITESLLMDNPEVAADWLRRLKALDVS
ncbi:MAG: PAS domain S-box protein, partial [Rhodospirillales bacterium]|nr:PAS domain S-box protein [Rhodospirillales bacterium]